AASERIGALLELELGLEIDDGDPGDETRGVDEASSPDGFEGGEVRRLVNRAFGARAMAVAGITNKRAIQGIAKRVKATSERDPLYLSPHERPLRLPGVDDVAVYTLGPPRDDDLLRSMDPVGAEGY